MAVKNITRNTVISTKSKVADSVLGRAIGLMFSFPSDSAMILKFGSDTAINLHMFFVFYPIDVMLINSRLKVVELKTLQPFTTFSAKNKAKYVVELPSGTIKRSKTRVGDLIAFLHVVERRLRNVRRITVRSSKSPKS